MEYALLEMTVSQGSLVMLGSYCPREKHGLGATAALAFAVSKLATMGSAVTLACAHGALNYDYENSTQLWGGKAHFALNQARHFQPVRGLF